MVAIAFAGRPDVRTFGDSTAGFASANSTVTLRDGATLVITSSYPLDRLGNRHPLKLAPDEWVPAGDGDAAVERAVAWLRRQPVCAPPH